jgi:hypothetical protein
MDHPEEWLFAGVNVMVPVDDPLTAVPPVIKTVSDDPGEPVKYK